MLNRLFPLRKPPPVLNGQYQPRWMEYQPKSNEKYMLFLHCISSLEGTSKGIGKTHLPDLLFLVVLYSYISFYYISRYHFPQIFRTSFNIWKKDVCHDFSFFNEFTQIPYPQRPKSAKHDERFLSMLLYFLCCRPNLKMLCMVLKSMVIFVKYHTCMLLLDCIGDHNWTSSSQEHLFLIFLVIHCSYSCAILLPYMLLS